MDNETFEYNDVNGNPLSEGDQVMFLCAPEELLKGLLTEDQVAIKAQVGKSLNVEGFDAYGKAELEFQSDDEHIHTIWVNSIHLEKQMSQSKEGK